MNNSEKKFVIPILLTVSASSYNEAMKQARLIVEDMSVNAKLETYFEHDNMGQRVLYLHPEEDPDYGSGNDGIAG